MKAQKLHHQLMLSIPWHNAVHWKGSRSKKIRSRCGSAKSPSTPESNQSRTTKSKHKPDQVVTGAIISLANKANGIDAQAVGVIVLQLKPELTHKRPVEEQDAQILCPRLQNLDWNKHPLYIPLCLISEIMQLLSLIMYTAEFFFLKSSEKICPNVGEIRSEGLGEWECNGASYSKSRMKPQWGIN